MKLVDLIEKTPQPQPLWEGKYKIPWDDPDYSRRMLKEHLTQEHDLASRTTATIDQHVDWIHNEILQGKPSRLLDLGCGPGLYSSRLTALSHTCHGIDFSPASIDYARQNRSDSDRCEFALGDIRTAEYGDDYDLAMIVYGEFNAFPPTEAAAILKKAHAALRPGGQLLLEAHTYDAIKSVGTGGNTWYQAETGLFSEQPHICLMTDSWYVLEATAHTRFTIIHAESGEVTVHDNTLRAYSPDEYHALLQEAGFSEVTSPPPWGKPAKADDPLMLLRAAKR